MNSGLTNAALAPARPVWRFEPSPASEAIWANDLLIQRIYECLIGEYEEDVDPVTRRDLINWMVLSKDRFVFFANLFWYGAAPEELLTAQKIGCSLERYNTYSCAVRVLHLDQTENDMQHPITPSVVRHWQSRLPNLAEIWLLGETGLLGEIPNVEKRVLVKRLFISNGRQIVVDHYIDASQSVQTDGETGAAPILTAVKATAMVPHLVQTDALGDIVRMFDPGTFGGFATGFSLAGLRELKILPAKDQQWFSIEMSRLDQILGLCPELRIIACRLAEPDALDPTEEALDTLFSRGSRLEVVHIETSGYLVPWLTALLRFRFVTLNCEPSLRTGDLDLLYGHVDAKPPVAPGLRHLIISPWQEATVETEEDCQPHLSGPYPVARIIQKLLPPGCEVQIGMDRLPRGRTQQDGSGRTWWKRFHDIMASMMRDVGPRRPVIRPMTKAELASQLGKRGEGPRD